MQMGEGDVGEMLTSGGGSYVLIAQPAVGADLA